MRLIDKMTYLTDENKIVTVSQNEANWFLGGNGTTWSMNGFAIHGEHNIVRPLMEAGGIYRLYNGKKITVQKSHHDHYKAGDGIWNKHGVYSLSKNPSMNIKERLDILPSVRIIGRKTLGKAEIVYGTVDGYPSVWDAKGRHLVDKKYDTLVSGYRELNGKTIYVDDSLRAEIFPGLVLQYNRDGTVESYHFSKNFKQKYRIQI